MALRALVFEGADVLAEVAAPVTDFGPDLAALTADMLDTMYDAKGRGLAAPQIGLSRRIFVMDANWKTGTPEPLHFINPVIAARAEETATGPEGCLSIPGKTFHVARPLWIDLAWQDSNGAAHQARFDGFEAVCACHEIDHLDGLLISQTGVPE